MMPPTRTLGLLLAPACALALAACTATGPVNAAGDSAPLAGPSHSAVEPVADPATPDGTGTPGTATVAAPPCRTADLGANVTTAVVYGMAWFALLVVTNQGPATCDLTGWPTLTGVADNGAATPAGRLAQPVMAGLTVGGAPTVLLRPGQSAGVDVSGGERALSGADCQSRYRWLRLAAPHDWRTITTSAYVSALGGGMPSCAGLVISPVHPLSDFDFPSGPHDGRTPR